MIDLKRLKTRAYRRLKPQEVKDLKAMALAKKNNHK